MNSMSRHGLRLLLGALLLSLAAFAFAQTPAAYPTKPIRIVVDNGKLSLYGTVATTMDKQIAGIRANQVFGVFSVQNNLEVVKGS